MVIIIRFWVKDTLSGRRCLLSGALVLGDRTLAYVDLLVGDLDELDPDVVGIEQERRPQAGEGAFVDHVDGSEEAPAPRRDLIAACMDVGHPERDVLGAECV